MRLKFVLARLPRKNNHKGEAKALDDGLFDGEGDLTLVGAESNLAGVSPVDRVVADGGADALGEEEKIHRGLRLGIRQLNIRPRELGSKLFKKKTSKMFSIQEVMVI